MSAAFQALHCHISFNNNRTFHNHCFPRRWVPEALCVLSPVLCDTVRAEKTPAKPFKKGKAKQHEQICAWLYTCALAQKPVASGMEPGSCAPGCGVAICFWSQSQSCNSSLPVAFSQYLPARQQRQEHLTGGGSTILLLTAPKPHNPGITIMGQNTPSQSPAPATPPEK